MKFVIYNGQNKFTIDNASVPALHKFITSQDPQEEEIEQDMSFTSLDLYDFRITSTRGAISIDELFPEINDDVQKEIDEGINWKQETIH